jgi:hypothetical protein
MNTVEKVGFYSALVAALATAGFTVAQVLQSLGLTASPWDAALIYGFSLGIAPAFLLAMLALHYSVPAEKQFWSHAAVLFAGLYTGFVGVMYTVQLATVIPYHVVNPVLAVAPHSFFWTLDALGYLCMGLAALLAVPVFANAGVQRRAKWFFLLHGLMTPVVAFVYFYPAFSTSLLYLAAPWCVTAIGSMLTLALFFRSARQQGAAAAGPYAAESREAHYYARIDVSR